MDTNSNVTNITDKESNLSSSTIQDLDVLPQPENNSQKPFSEENEKCDSEIDSDAAIIEENDLYESADKVAAEVQHDSVSSAEDESEAAEDSVWKRKKVVKKRKFKSERRDPGYETIDVDSMQTRSKSEKRVGYENVDFDSENRNKSAQYSQVTRKRITSDISGRMVIAEGSQYEDTDEYSKKVQTLERSTDTLRLSSEAIEAEKSRDDVVVLEEEQAGSSGEWSQDDEIYGDTIVESEKNHIPHAASEGHTTGIISRYFT